MHNISKPFPEDGQILAAIDLGSNSFHMAVARVNGGDVRLIQKFGEKVRLAAGLDRDNNLSDEAFKRGLDCLRRFADVSGTIDPRWLRCVATNTLRKARNGADFIAQAEAILGCSVEIIAGREEARLVYHGVAQTLPPLSGRRLVFDIGGGSTEFIVGQDFEPILTESLHMGCVSYRQRFFGDGVITRARFNEAVLAARREVWSVSPAYRTMGWSQAIGSSGTVKAVRNALEAEGVSPVIITPENVSALVERVLAFKTTDDIEIEGVKPDRCTVLPSGLAILQGVMEGMGITSLEYSDGALREGVLYEMVGRTYSDICERTIEALVSRYSIDAAQAKRVDRIAASLLGQVRASWGLQDDKYARWLSWAARSHEIGLIISHARFHTHGSYMLRHSDLAGFTQKTQLILATMVGAHRRKIRSGLFDELPENARSHVLKLTLLLRLAVLLCRARSDSDVVMPSLTATESGLKVVFEAGALAEHSLTAAELQQEVHYWKKTDFELII